MASIKLVGAALLGKPGAIWKRSRRHSPLFAPPKMRGYHYCMRRRIAPRYLTGKGEVCCSCR
ncbi:hypothetical protein NLY39_00210 [Pseudomonas sp. KHPS1]|nr:hypothetical protein [Pseudomonas sp. KHPS1]ATH79829.1 hypothetical protein CO724_01140 [Pseudomonas mendocina]UTH36604.1 hypothetical protein NLY39_00210 [Pseudomonas sp. KHPS1]